MNVLPPTGFVNWVASLNMWTVLGVLVGLAIVLFAVSGLVKNLSRAGPAVKSSVKLKAMAERWQLMLLGATGIVLSLASGYTTWMGMTNFTGEWTLSLMVTFGIQGVMLIVAWLIGESFATGMNRRLPDGRQSPSRLDPVIGMVLAVALVGAVFYFVLHQSQTITWSKTGVPEPVNWARFADVSVYFALALLVIAVLAFNFRQKGELSLPYVQSSRVIVKNAVLWVMFLACMATSVFFSFDSLFTAIFPKEERARAAQLRAQNQVAGIVADIGDTIERRRSTEIETLFRSKGWRDYDTHLVALGKEAAGAQAAIERFFTDQLEAKNRAIKEQQERIATANSGSAGLQAKKTTLTDELARLKGERPALAAEHAEKKTELDNRAKALDAKRVEAQAEDRGAEGTLKQGKGPVFRALMAELARMQDAYKIQEERVRDAQRRLNTVDTRIAQIERELAAVDGELAKLRGESDTAEQRIRLTQESAAGDPSQRVDPARALASFEMARASFTQGPTAEQLMRVQTLCTDLQRAMASTPVTKPRVASISCDAKGANEASTVMFALNEGLKAFESSCAGGDKLAAHATTDALWGFARKCLADSGLPSRETDQLRTKINFAELSRDDKAHPFVATINAFQDGNRLAHLALAIAIAMDLLVFMSGLFGANAVRSPLSDVPSHKARSGRQLDAIIENALLPDTFENARLVLGAMRPMTPRDGFSARVVIPPGDPHAPDIRRVLNAAAAIGAVRHLEAREETYEVRAELFEFLSVIAKKAFEGNEENARLAELRKVVTVALQPHVGDNADVVIQHCHPCAVDADHSAEIFLDEMDANDAYVSRRALNAASTVNYAKRIPTEDYARKDRSMARNRDGYYVHKQLYKTLLLISAAYPKTGQRSGVPQLAGPDQSQPRLGGDITPRAAAIEQDPATQQGALPRLVSRLAQAAPGAAGGEARAGAAAGGRQDRRGEAEESDDEVRNRFWNRFMGVLGIEPQVATARLKVDGLSEAAQGAWNALVEHGRTNSRLAELLRRHQSQQDDRLGAEYNEISQALAGSRRHIDLLDEVDHIVRSHLPALMVFPENGLLAFIVREIERAAGPDNGLRHGEQQLKDRLKGLQLDIAGQDLESVNAWDEIAEWFRGQHSPEKGHLINMPGVRRQR